MGFESFNNQDLSQTENETDVNIDSDESTLALFGGEISPESFQDNENASYEDDSEKLFDNPEVVAKYNFSKTETLNHLSQIDSLLGEYGDIDKDDLYQGELLEQRDLLQKELVRLSANFPGNWTQLLHERMLDQVTKDKFIAQRNEAASAMKTGPLEFRDKPTQFKEHYQKQIEDYDRRIENIFSITETGRASDFGKSPHTLGVGDIDKPGAVFVDAVNKNNLPLSVRQKNIVEAHEKGHGLRDFESPVDKTEIRNVIDREVAESLLQQYREKESNGEKGERGRFNYSYLTRPEEIIERMAQFKNYFGMGAKEQFTEAHLDYIRANYILDTGLDNGVSNLLACITPRTTASFLEIINKYPI